MYSHPLHLQQVPLGCFQHLLLGAEDVIPLIISQPCNHLGLSIKCSQAELLISNKLLQCWKSTREGVIPSISQIILTLGSLASDNPPILTQHSIHRISKYGKHVHRSKWDSCSQKCSLKI